MKLFLTSHIITDIHRKRMVDLCPKPAGQVNFAYLTTPINDRDKEPDWFIETRDVLQSVFPKLVSFDLESTYKENPKFNFDKYFSEQDFVFVSGGNSIILAYWMKKTGAREILKDLIESDRIVYGGESAGMIYVYEELETYSSLDDPENAPAKVFDGLGIVDFAPIPHWNNERFAEGLREIDKKFIDKGVKTYPVNEDQALVVENNNIELI